MYVLHKFPYLCLQKIEYLSLLFLMFSFLFAVIEEWKDTNFFDFEEIGTKSNIQSSSVVMQRYWLSPALLLCIPWYLAI